MDDHNLLESTDDYFRTGYCIASPNLSILFRENKLYLKQLGTCITFQSDLCSRPFPSCFGPHYESEAKCKVFVMEISFHSHAKKPNFHMKRFALSLAFKMRFTATGKWPIGAHILKIYNMLTMIFLQLNDQA